jgi:hypothetical protein
MNAGMKMLVSRTVGGAALILGGLFNQAAAETITYIHTDALGHRSLRLTRLAALSGVPPMSPMAPWLVGPLLMGLATQGT